MTHPYEPESFWDHKAVMSHGGARAAVCLGDPLRDACIDKIQRRLMGVALSRLNAHRSLLGVKVLDHGCGTGRWFGLLTRLGCDYQGVDISGEMVEMAHQEHPGGRFLKTNGLALPFPDREFSLVVSLAVLHHNDYERQDRLMSELSRVLEPGGNLIFFEGIGRRNAENGGPFFHRPADEWLAALSGHGLSCWWQRATRYFTLASLASAVVRRATGRHRLPGALESLLLRLDAIVDPLLLAHKPWRSHDRWFAVLSKPPN